MIEAAESEDESDSAFDWGLTDRSPKCLARLCDNEKLESEFCYRDSGDSRLIGEYARIAIWMFAWKHWLAECCGSGSQRNRISRRFTNGTVPVSAAGSDEASATTLIVPSGQTSSCRTS